VGRDPGSAASSRSSPSVDPIPKDAREAENPTQWSPGQKSFFTRRTPRGRRLKTGDRVSLVYAGKKARFRVVWVGEGDTLREHHVGLLLDLELVVHLIGERPGTGIDAMSAYLTYGRDRASRSRWGLNFDHSWTTAVCGIHHRGKQHEVAAEEISRLVSEMLKQRCSGVSLRRPTL